MNAQNDSRVGSCYCGSVRYRVSGEVEAFFCHCTDCRHNSGAPYVAWGRAKAKSFDLLSGALSDFNSSNKVVWFFCGSCGTTIKYQNTDTVSEIDFMLATLEAPEKIAPQYHIQIREKLAWVELSDNLPKFERWRHSNA